MRHGPRPPPSLLTTALVGARSWWWTSRPPPTARPATGGTAVPRISATIRAGTWGNALSAPTTATAREERAEGRPTAGERRARETDPDQHNLGPKPRRERRLGGRGAGTALILRGAEGGLEPPHPCGHMTLNHARLPIRHFGPDSGERSCQHSASPGGLTPASVRQIGSPGSRNGRHIPGTGPELGLRERARTIKLAPRSSCRLDGFRAERDAK